MRHLLSAITLTALTLASAAAHADTLKSETEVRQLTDKVMAAAGKGRTDDAYAAMTPYALADVSTIDRARISARNWSNTSVPRWVMNSSAAKRWASRCSSWSI